MDQDYLDSSFDANSLTKPQLRSVLASHGVTDLPPVSAKKKVLLQLFDNHIKYRAKEIKAAFAKVRPSARGILQLDEQSRPSPSSSSPTKRASPTSTGKGIKSTPSSSPTLSPSLRAKRSMARDSITVVQEALPRYADSPASAKHKLSQRITTINSKLEKVSGMPFSLSSFPWKLVKDAISLMTFLTLVVLVCFYLRWKLLHPFPYCESGTALHWAWTPSLRSLTDIDAWVSILKTNCLACPAHGTCYDGKLTCQDGYIAAPNVAYFGAQCIPDRKKIWLIDQVAQHILKDLRKRSDVAFCTRQSSSKYLAIDNSYMDTLRRRFPDVKDPDQFEALIKLALDDLHKNFNVRGERGQWWLAGAKAPLSCMLQNYLLHWYLKHRVQIVSSLLLLSISILVAVYVRWTFFYWGQVQDMTRAIFQMLAENAALHKRDFTVPAAIPIDQLRDAMLLTPKYQSFLRKRVFLWVWPQVVRNVSRNANISETELHSRHGVVNQWEWIGMDIFNKRSVVEVSEEDDTAQVFTPSKRSNYPKLL